MVLVLTTAAYGFRAVRECRKVEDVTAVLDAWRNEYGFAFESDKAEDEIGGYLDREKEYGLLGKYAGGNVYRARLNAGRKGPKDGFIVTVLTYAG